jgi:hypothetical protein
LINLIAILCCVLFFVCLIGLAISIRRGLVNGSQRWSGAACWTMALGTVALAVLILRPHEDVFQGLDCSAYRLMAKAFQQGRPFQNIDTTLLEVPQDLRHWLLLRSDTVDRLTRDRSFEITSLRTGVTRPFFYPFLPLCMVGFDLLVPGNALDYFVPVVGLIFATTLLAIGISFGGVIGGLLALALFMGTPLPVWLLRGCFAESPAAVLLAMGFLSWIIRRQDFDRPPFTAFLACGLAVSFHPVMIVIAVPAAGIMLMCDEGPVVGVLGRIAAAALGVVPFVLMTLFVTAPYFQLSARGALGGIRDSQSIQSAVVPAVAMGLLFLVGLFKRRQITSAIAAFHERHGISTSLLLAVLCVLPTVLVMRFWTDSAAVSRGFGELCDGMRLPLGIAMILLCLATLLSSHAPRAKVALLIAFVCLPVFLYLKGAEQMGLWSQRRLIAPLLIVMAGCLPAGALTLSWTIGPGFARRGRIVLVVLLLCVVGLSNTLKLRGVRDVWPNAPRSVLEHGWPAPYVVQYEKGADKWVARMLQRIGRKFAICDLYAYSVPLSVNGKTRVVGLTELQYAATGLGEIAPWLAEKAAKEKVLWITAYRNPGMEEGVILEQEGQRELITLRRANAVTALPAYKEKLKINAGLLHLRPVQDGDQPVMDKVFDGGFLGLRQPWGRSDIPIRIPSNDLPAQWSREGSGIVGPVPRPGGAIRINVIAVASRTNLVDTQTLKFQPPWGGEPLALLISNGLTDVTGELIRPSDQQDNGVRTGIYRIHSADPYDPMKEGIPGFNKDLGALIHRIRIQLVPSGNSGA